MCAVLAVLEVQIQCMEGFDRDIIKMHKLTCLCKIIKWCILFDKKQWNPLEQKKKTVITPRCKVKLIWHFLKGHNWTMSTTVTFYLCLVLENERIGKLRNWFHLNQLRQHWTIGSAFMRQIRLKWHSAYSSWVCLEVYVGYWTRFKNNLHKTG